MVGLIVAEEQVKCLIQIAQLHEASGASGLTSFDSDGYTMGTYYNQSGREYMGWCWKCGGGTTSSNTDGDKLQVQYKLIKKQDLVYVEYTGSLTSSATKTIGHGLSKAPELMDN